MPSGKSSDRWCGTSIRPTQSTMVSKKISPPIVGVPVFTRCDCGPSSRIGCPLPCLSRSMEIIPGPSISINMRVHPGDTINVNIREVVKNTNVWVIVIQNWTTGASFQRTVPYTSTHTTAEWIVETPLSFGTGGVGLTALPNLGKVHFDSAKANNLGAGLRAKEQIQLVDGKGQVIATPSAPDAQADGFYDCTWSTSC